MRTLEELERMAYINGHTEIADTLGELIVRTLEVEALGELIVRTLEVEALEDKVEHLEETLYERTH